MYENVILFTKINVCFCNEVEIIKYGRIPFLIKKKKMAAMVKLKQIILRTFVILLLAFISYCVYLFYSFNPNDFSKDVSQDSKYYDPFASRYSKQVIDKDGNLLSVFLNKNEQWHLNDINEIPNKLKTCVITYEDKNFYSHFGIDFLALMRTIKNNATKGSRAGASTLSMQVVKLLDSKERTYFNKFKESIYALRLESLYEKDSILQMYLNNAPYGGNIVGFKSAALLYFAKKPSDLTWAESALLAVLPNSPGLINLNKNRILLEKKRNALLQKLYDKNIIDSTILNISLKEPIPYMQRHKNIAPHLSLRVIKEDKQNHTILQTTIKKDIQEKFETRVKEYNEELKRQGILNVSSLLLDSTNGEVLAYIGSQDFLDIQSFGQIDGIKALRSPGSLLKPLLYALSIDNGLIAPDSMLVDVPLFFSNFNPKNASNSYYGLISAKDSLIKSLNVPFVNLLQQYGVNKFFYDLKNILHFNDNDPTKYGLSLILGTKEMSVENIARIYLGLANYGEFGKIYYTIPHDIESKNKILSRGASFLTLQATKELHRPGLENIHKDKKIISWKTGTSFGQRDAWAAGVTPLYTLVVWVGNFTGGSNNDILGTKDAGELFFTLLDELDSTDKEFNTPNDLKEILIDDITGYAITQDLNEYNIPTKKILFPLESKPLRPSPFLKKVWIDDKNKEVDSNNPNFINAKPSIKLELPLEVLNYYKIQNVNIYSLVNNNKDSALKIIYPTNDLKILEVNDLNKKQNLILRIANLKKQKVFWYIDGEYLGDIHSDTKSVELGLGTHTLTIIAQDGSKDSVTFHIEK